MENATEKKKRETIQDDPTNSDIYTCIDDIAKYPEKADKGLNAIKKILECLQERKRLVDLINEANKNREGETALHMAIRCFQFERPEEREVVKLLISTYPKLMLQDRRSTKYAGPTPLHMAVCKKNMWLVTTLLKKMPEKHSKNVLLKRRANGAMFTNTVMMGELPLTIAALTFKNEIFDLLLTKGADLDGVNSLGDNVCHSLIRYAHLYPDKLNKVLDMSRKIKDDKEPVSSEIKDEEEPVRSKIKDDKEPISRKIKDDKEPKYRKLEDDKDPMSRKINDKEPMWHKKTKAKSPIKPL